MNHNSVRVALGALLLAAVPFAASAFEPKTEPASSTTAQKKVIRNRWPAENLSGRIDMVLPGQNLVIVKDSQGTPYDFVVNHDTRIVAGSQRLKLADLSSKKNDQVKIRFVPERKGDIAASIHLN